MEFKVKARPDSCDPLDMVLFDFAEDGMDYVSLLGEVISVGLAYQRELIEVLNLTIPEDLKPRLKMLKYERL